MASKTTIAYIRSLHNKEDRQKEQVFLVEGWKSISEFLNSNYIIVGWFFTEKFASWKVFSFPFQIVTDAEIARMTTLMSNDAGMLIVEMRPNILPEILQDELVLILDGISDPGNLGTIIRTADWYGISHIIASNDTVDCYNPKVIMATMGSSSRTSIFYTDIESYLSKNTKKVYWAYLDWESTHIKVFSHLGAYLIIGNEAHGIRPNLDKHVTDKITIPRFGRAESLNASVATAVILDRMVWSTQP